MTQVVFKPVVDNVIETMKNLKQQSIPHPLANGAIPEGSFKFPDKGLNVPSGHIDIPCESMSCSCSEFSLGQVIFGGDWEYLAHCRGHSGPNGLHFCKFCLTVLSSLQRGIPHNVTVTELVNLQGNKRSHFYSVLK